MDPLAQLKSLPRKVYGHAQALPNIALAYAHRHPWGQLSYAVSGVLEIHTRGARFVAPPQRAVWIPPGIRHRVTCPADTCIRSLYIEHTFAEWAPDRCRVMAIAPLVRELIKSFSQLPVEYALDGAHARLVEVLLDQLSIAPEQALNLPLPQDPRLHTLCRRLQTHPDDTTTLAQWSETLGVSQKTLSRIFLRETGLNFRAWRQRMRLLNALPALERGERVTDIALASGYESLSAFIAAFRSQFALSPGEFAKAATGE